MSKTFTHFSLMLKRQIYWMTKQIMWSRHSSYVTTRYFKNQIQMSTLSTMRLKTVLQSAAKERK